MKQNQLIRPQRDEAFLIFPYPCIGEFRFLDLALCQSPHYPTILQRLQTGNENFLDLGCCFGHEMRKLVADGCPSDHIYASDLRPEFFELGYKLFGDKDTLKSKFIAADIFDASSALSSLDGEVDIIFAASFLHLFGYKDQVEICKRMVKLLRDKKDSMVLGRQVGNVVAGERTRETRSRWRHNEESFRKMWDEVGESTGTKWKVEVEALPLPGWYTNGQSKLRESGVTRLRFAVIREE
jgi:hypothetical protein